MCECMHTWYESRLNQRGSLSLNGMFSLARPPFMPGGKMHSIDYVSYRFVCACVCNWRYRHVTYLCLSLTRAHEYTDVRRGKKNWTESHRTCEQTGEHFSSFSFFLRIVFSWSSALTAEATLDCNSCDFSCVRVNWYSLLCSHCWMRFPVNCRESAQKKRNNTAWKLPLWTTLVAKWAS